MIVSFEAALQRSFVQNEATTVGQIWHIFTFALHHVKNIARKSNSDEHPLIRRMQTLSVDTLGRQNYFEHSLCAFGLA